ncbi:MAG TPA: hypothetical protein EYP56_21975, partial [Planctomycetaceae bacterium]|nr:hypothetical protein [Planctomycetaceae bacterium]
MLLRISRFAATGNRCTRIGATDVVPFIPISGVTMQECVEIAERLGQRVADELDIPVY